MSNLAVGCAAGALCALAFGNVSDAILFVWFGAVSFGLRRRP